MNGWQGLALGGNDHMVVVVGVWSADCWRPLWSKKVISVGGNGERARAMEVDVLPLAVTAMPDARLL